MGTGIGAGVETTGHGRLAQQIGVFDQALDVAADLFEVVVDHRLLAGEAFQRHRQIAFAEALDAGHGLCRIAQVAGDHGVDAFGHAAEGALEALDGNAGIGLAAIMGGGQLHHLRDQQLDVVAHLLKVVVDHRLPAGETLQRRGQIAFAEAFDAGHGLGRIAQVTGDHGVDAFGDVAEGALEALQRDAFVGLAAIMLAGHGAHLLHQTAQGHHHALHGGHQAGIVAGAQLQIVGQVARGGAVGDLGHLGRLAAELTQQVAGDEEAEQADQ